MLGFSLCVGIFAAPQKRASRRVRQDARQVAGPPCCSVRLSGRGSEVLAALPKRVRQRVWQPTNLVLLSPCCIWQALLLTPQIYCSPVKAGEAEGEATDKAGWERYSVDWRNYFECMLAPVARQAAGEPPHL